MSIITTTYTERLTITTDDAGRVTTTRTSHADTATEYLFSELSEEAQTRAISAAIEEEDRDYCEYGTYGASQTGTSAAQIWDAAEDLAKAQPVELSTDQGGSPYGTARGMNSWYHWPADWKAVTEQQHTGTCYSMDICDAWNKHAARVIALQEAHEEATAAMWEHEEAADQADAAADEAGDAIEAARLEAIAEAERTAAQAYESIAERIEDAAEEETEEAARAVGDVVDGLIEGEHDYYTSAEFWREWLDDGEARFTRDGERI